MTITDQKIALDPVVEVFRGEGFYAYGTFDDENRWCVACDVEDGHIDVRIGDDGFEMDAWATLTGMYVDEENVRRRYALERLARVSIPSIQRGMLDDTELLHWDDVEKGIALRKTIQLPFATTEMLPEIAMRQLQDVNETLLFLARQINS
ncbi:MAG: hypothetical protein R3A46_11835 [Thermomicrobiales bacterium]